MRIVVPGAKFEGLTFWVEMLEYMQWWSQYATRASHHSSVPTSPREAAYSPAASRMELSKTKSGKHRALRIAAFHPERLMVLWSKVEEGDRGRICAAEPGVCDQSSSRLVATLAVCLALCYTSIHPHARLAEENTIFMVWPKYHPEKASVCCPLPRRYIHWCCNFDAAGVNVDDSDGDLAGDDGYAGQYG